VTAEVHPTAVSRQVCWPWRCPGALSCHITNQTTRGDVFFKALYNPVMILFHGARTASGFGWLGAHDRVGEAEGGDASASRSKASTVGLGTTNRLAWFVLKPTVAAPLGTCPRPGVAAERRHLPFMSDVSAHSSLHLLGCRE